MKNEKIVFIDKEHSYTYNGKPYKSVSHLFKIVQPYKDWDFISSKSTLRAMVPDKYKYLSKTIGWDSPDMVKELLKFVDLNKFKEELKKLRKEWKDNNVKATTRGTAFHSLKEQEDYDRGYCVNLHDNKEYITQVYKKTHDNESIVENLFDLPDGYYAELLVFNHKYEIAGQIDKCFISTGENGTRYIDIDDWKTDAEINRKPKFFHPKKGLEMLEFPLNHMYDCNYNHYTIKLSTYAWMLEDAGFEIRSIRFTSVDIEDDLTLNSETPCIVPYKRWEVEQIIERNQNNS